MQELLTVNERYHELLTISEGQRMDLEIAQTDLAQLRPALAEAEVRLFEQAEALDRAQSTAASLQASNDLLVAKNAALDAESADLHKVLKSYAAQLLESEAELTVTKQRNLEVTTPSKPLPSAACLSCGGCSGRAHWLALTLASCASLRATPSSRRPRRCSLRTGRPDTTRASSSSRPR